MLMETYRRKKYKVGPVFYSAVNQVLEGSDIYVDDQSQLHFPVLFIYEEFHQSDIIKANLFLYHHLDLYELHRLIWCR